MRNVRIGRRTALLAAMIALAGFGLQPATTGRAGLGDFDPSCPAVTSVPANMGKVLNYTGTLTCYRPGGSVVFGKDVAPPDRQVRVDQPKLGDECRDIFNHRVRFSEDTGGNWQGIYAILGNATEGSNPINADDAAMMGTHDAFVTDVQLGSYEPSNPADQNSALQCELNPTFHFFCPNTGNLDELCFSWLLHPIAPASSAPQAWGPFFAQRIAELNAQAGTINSAPSTRGVVNTPLCFWIDDMGIPSEQDMTLVLPGAPDASGRQIFYTFLARFQFQGVTWNFDDPNGNQVQDAPSDCDGHPQVVAHTYRQISDERNADGKYHVTATENYSIQVRVFWWDSDGFHNEDVDPGVATPTLLPGTLPQYVGQVEGIPIGSAP